MALHNPSFEDAGLLPGEAAHWTLTAVTSLEVLAGFGSAPEQGVEDFEQWYVFVDHIEKLTAVRAFFGTALLGVESFDAEWLSGVFLRELPSAQLAFAALGRGDIEHFETSWANDTFAGRWSEVDAVAAGSDGFEAFERGWQGNEGFASQWTEVTPLPARFSAGALAYEVFETGWPTAATI